MTHRICIEEESFQAIKSGYKTVEIIASNDVPSNLKVGDEIVLSQAGSKVLTEFKKILFLKQFDNIELAYKSTEPLKCGYTPFTLSDASPDDYVRRFGIGSGLGNGISILGFEEAPLQRFLAGQSGVLPDCSGYNKALEEIKVGRKDTHWIWYIFPHIKGLPAPDHTTEYYAFADLEEAKSFYEHPILGKRLIEITEELIKSKTDDPVSIFGMGDAFKFRASMTLFEAMI